MKRMAFLWVAMAAIMFSSCEKKTMKLYPTLEGSASFTATNVGQFASEVTITRAQIEANLADLDIPDEGTIEGVSIEAISLVIAPKADNQAVSVKVSGSIAELSTSNPKSFVAAFPLNVPSASTEFKVPAGYLQAPGLTEITGQLDKIIRTGELPASFTGLKLSVQGASMPLDKKLSLDITVKVKVTVVYSQEVGS
jgi:hypothetical protein